MSCTCPTCLSVINLVSGDDNPPLLVQLWDKSSDKAFNLSDPNITVKLRFREEGNTTSSLFELTGVKQQDGTTGIVLFTFGATDLDVEEGDYEGEIHIDNSGAVQTVYDLIKFFIRDDFPAIA